MAFTITERTEGRNTIKTMGMYTVLVDSQADLANLPQELRAGSTAYTADLANIWIKANDGTWTAV